MLLISWSHVAAVNCAEICENSKLDKVEKAASGQEVAGTRGEIRKWVKWVK
jgi:hypothetical protein